MIFLDLREAFYRIVKELAIGGTPCDDIIAAMGSGLGMGTSLLHDLYEHLAQSPAIACSGMSPVMQNMVRALHSDTHFHL